METMIALVAERPLLFERLESETREARSRVEATLFVQELFRGSWGPGVFGRYVRVGHYVAYLQQLHRIYIALEESLGSAQGWRELWRSPAIEHDLDTLVGRTPPPAPPAVTTQVYLSRIWELRREAPQLLAAHAFVRCALDVLCGPERLERLSGALGLPRGVGGTLYRAVPADGMGRYRELLESRLERMVLSEATAFELIDEARTGFRLNALLFDELARGALGLQRGL